MRGKGGSILNIEKYFCWLLLLLSLTTKNIFFLESFQSKPTQHLILLSAEWEWVPDFTESKSWPFKGSIVGESDLKVL